MSWPKQKKRLSISADGQEQETVQYVKQQLENMNQVESKLAEV